MPDTVAGLFRTRSEAESALGKLKDAGFGADQIAISTPANRRRGHYLTKHLAGLVLGVVVGAVLGAGLVALVPSLRAIFHAPLIVACALGAIALGVTGGLAGGLFSMAASGDRALYYEQEVESGRVLVSVVGARLDVAAALLEEAGALEAAPVEAPLERGRPRPESG